jgi:hypothetical protein
MVSDVSADIEKAAKAATPKAPEPPPAPPPPPTTPPVTPPPASGGKSNYSAPGKSGPSWLGWVIAGVVVLVIWIANSGSGNKTSTPSPRSPEPTYLSQAPATPPASAPVSDTQKPAVGRNQVLGVAQIRYCKTEKIRIEAFESVINNAFDHEVDRFNGIVNDYNSRCGEFRYRRGDVERVERELSPERESITSKAKSEWVRNSLGLKDSPAPISASKDPLRSGESESQSTKAPAEKSKPLSMEDLSYAETESIESACNGDRILNGPAAYNRCLAGKLASLKSAPRNIDLSSLSHAETESIESACNGDRILNGPAAYNRCLAGKLRQLRR